MNKEQQEQFKESFRQMQDAIHQTAKDKGWWRLRHKMADVCKDSSDELGEFADRCNQITCLSLIITELSEAIEAIRNGNPKDDKIPKFNGATAECADVVIRMADLAAVCNWDIAGAIIEKAEFNKTRPTMHGKKA